MTLPRLLLLAYCICSAFAVFAQQRVDIDSLKRLLHTHTQEDTLRAFLFNKICWENRNNNFLEAVEFGKEGIALSEKISYYKGQCEGLNFLGVVYRNMGEYLDASGRFYQALSIAEARHIEEQIAYSHNNIGDVLRLQKLYSQALFHVEKAKNIFEKMGNQRGLGFTYARLGEIYQGLKSYQKSFEAFYRSLEIREKTKDWENLITSYTRLGALETLNSRYPQALEYHQKALKIAQELRNRRSVSTSRLNIAEVYHAWHRPQEAMEYAQESLRISLQLQAKGDERNAYKLLAKIAEQQGDFKNAHLYNKYFLRLSDSLDNTEKSSQLAKMQAIYDTKKRIQENEVLRKDKKIEEQAKQTRTLMLGGAMLALMLTLVGIFFALRSRQKQARLASRIQQQKAEIEERNQKMERNINLVLQLSKSEAIADGDWHKIAQEMTQTVCIGLQAQASSLWNYSFRGDKFYCMGGKGDAFQTMEKIQVPFLSSVLQGETLRTVNDVATCIDVDDASRAFFLSKGIRALIVSPHILSDNQKGVLLAYQNAPKTWDIEDKAFMKSIDDTILIAYQGQKRKQAQAEIEMQHKEIAQKNESLRTTLKLVREEQKRTDDLLLNILPWQVAEELKEHGFAKPAHYSLVTVLFTDFSGFTQIAEKLSPQEIIAELDTCFHAFDEICERHNLEKIKTIGDSYMCAGGIPMANQTNPVDAVRAALEMQKWMAQWTQQKIAAGKDAWQIRLGIHSGEVVAGIVGKKKFAYDIWGDAVNVASRMESSGEVGKVNISGATYEHIKDLFVCTFRGKVRAKNKGDIDMYFVEKAR